MAIFDPTQNRHPSTDHQKICHRWLRRRPLRLCQIRCISVHERLLDTWVKYNQNNFYLCPLYWELTCRSDPSTDFHAWWLKRRRHVQVCAFWGIFHIAPHLGVQSPQTTNFGAWISVLSKIREIEKRAYYQNYCIDFNQILHTDKDHQMPFVGDLDTRITNPIWQATAILKKMKNRYYVQRVSSDFNEIWVTDAVRPSWHFTPLKISNYKNLRWRLSFSWKIEKSPYLGRGMTDFDETWHADKAWSSLPLWLLKIWNIENLICRRPPFWKIKK